MKDDKTGDGLPPTNKQVGCRECGMICAAGEYHPYAACLMFKACHNGDTVRGNLEDIRQAAIAAAVARERYKWELLTNQVLSDAEAQGVLSEWWEPMQAAIRNGD